MELYKLKPILTAAEAAEVLRTTPRTIQRLCNEGAIVSCRAGNRYRINRDSLLRYVGLGAIETEE